MIEYYEFRVSQCPECDVIKVQKTLTSYNFWNDPMHCIAKNDNILRGSADIDKINRITNYYE